MNPYSLLAPGPVALHPEVIKILSLPMLHHRTPEFDQIFQRCLENLKYVYGTKQPCYMLMSTGSGGMEALVVNCLSPGDEVLAIVSGKFGERWAEMAKVYGMKTHVMNIEWGKACDPAQVRAHLEKNPATRAVLVQACETSTGVLHPVRELGAITREHPGTLLLVDAISAMATTPLPMDDWGIDGMVSGSQKAFMLPAGLAFVSCSAKAWGHIEKSTSPRFYLDLRRERKANEKEKQGMFTAEVPNIRALDWVLAQMKEHGLDAWMKPVQRRADWTRAYAARVGLKQFTACPSPSVTVLETPAGVDSAAIRGQLEKEYNITVMGGQEQIKGKVLRIGHMGYIRDEEMLNLFTALSKLLKLPDVTEEMRQWARAHP